MTNYTVMQQSSPVISLSSDQFAQISASRAVVVVEQVSTKSNPFYDQNALHENVSNDNDDDEVENGNDIILHEEEEDKEFEFPLISTNSASADDIFYDGKILPMYSVSGNYSQLKSGIEITLPAISSPAESVRLPLRLLFLVDREEESPPRFSSSCSSSESEEFDGVTPGSYCKWEPKTVECKKSNSTGTSKRLKFRNFLNRSSSDGSREDTIVYPTPPTNEPKKDEKLDRSPQISGKVSAAAVVDLFAKGGGEKRRQSPLPYRQDMVGFFGNANGTKWNLHPF